MAGAGQFDGQGDPHSPSLNEHVHFHAFVVDRTLHPELSIEPG